MFLKMAKTIKSLSGTEMSDKVYEHQMNNHNWGNNQSLSSVFTSDHMLRERKIRELFSQKCKI